MRGNRRLALTMLAVISVAVGARVSAHRLDEYLQAARIAIEPDRVELELSLTPGVAVADGVIREIDADANGVLSREEQHAYSRRVLSAIALRVDDAPLPEMALTASTFPDIAAIRTGSGVITLRSEAALPFLSPGSHHVSFRNGNAAGNSAYLANALVPESTRVAVTDQQRVGDQSQLTIDFAIRERPAASSRRWMWIGFIGVLALAVPLMRRTYVNAKPA